MSKATVRLGQTLEDIAVQYLGSDESVFALAQLNGLDLTATLSVGQVLRLPDVADRRVRKVFSDEGYQPAVGVIDEQPSGVGFWGIGVDFQVS